MFFLFCILASALGSFLVGGIGTGSSLILLPALIVIFDHAFTGFDSLRLAAGTTIATIAVGAIAGGISRFRAGQVDVQLLRLLIVPYILGGFIGPWIGKLLSVQGLQIYIAGLLFCAGLKMLYTKRGDITALRDYNEYKIQITLVLTLIGVISSMGGIASGLFAIPFLMRFALPMHLIAGTSTMAAAVYASVASVGYVTAGLGEADLPDASLGYVYLPAFIVMALTAMVFTPLGVKFSQKLNDHILQRALALFLLIAAIVVIAR